MNGRDILTSWWFQPAGKVDNACTRQLSAVPETMEYTGQVTQNDFGSVDTPPVLQNDIALAGAGDRQELTHQPPWWVPAPDEANGQATTTLKSPVSQG
ncbi:hypothetical protein ATEIFO6365_0001030700 [Aspergillus terreus]|uniref:Uncharacterized protein n=1 Tax=Aspergillus terreus TaxID=33178 RepID=A0A5M3YL54_ASPTE|nr:hypothetical protein ATETN484_0001022800 [Aspergillus terreus]GFF12084.1 hypothetical protein ATEIFO6365_0001030700 [Aspergillus terreus]